MSFLGDLVNSIGTKNAPIHPKPAPKPPITSSAAHSNPAPRPKELPGTTTPPVVGGLKRKLDERDLKISRPVEKTVKPNPAPSLSSKPSQRSGTQVINGIRPVAPKPVALKPPASKPVISSGPVAPLTPTKPPTKGSYAEMMARAKVAQQSRTQNPLGTIKHQASSKEKISKLAERRRQEQEKLKSGKDKKPEKASSAGKVDRKRGESPVKKADQAKVPRAPRPPLHAPSSSYKGTMGTASKKPSQGRDSRRTQKDEYLGTDEEEDSEMEDVDDDDGYGYSDASSDMEAGLDDIDMEEQKALRAAREDDAKEQALESQLKREKEERKRRLQAMAKKSR